MADDTSRFMAMKGAGYYSQATAGARDVISAAIPVVEAALAAQNLENSHAPLVMTDMGAADGGTSLPMWTAVLQGLRATLPDRPLQLVYTDLPKNDFSQLFQIVHGQTELPAYMDLVDNLYVMASATSFHKPMVPPGTLHLGFSATASHYVSETPAQIPDHVHMVGAKGPVREAFEHQGARDWEAFLCARAQELAPGGRLVLYNFGIDEQGRYLGHTGGESMFDTFNRLWQGLVADGVITETEYRNTNFPQHYRTVAEFAAPFNDPANPVYRAGLRLEEIETQHTRCPFEADFTDGHRDPVRFARAYVPTLRSWSEPTFVAGLDQARGPAQISEIIDRFYGAYQDAVAANPDGHAMDYTHARLVASKTG